MKFKIAHYLTKLCQVIFKTEQNRAKKKKGGGNTVQN